MNLTKAELKASLQAHLDLKYGSSKYTVGDGVEFIALAQDLKSDALKTYHTGLEALTQSMFCGSLNLRNSHSSTPANVAVAHNPLMTQANRDGYEEHLASEVVIPVGQEKQLPEVVFSYLSGSNFEGNFHGFKFEVDSVYSILESGLIEQEEDLSLVLRP